MSKILSLAEKGDINSPFNDQVSNSILPTSSPLELAMKRFIDNKFQENTKLQEKFHEIMT